MLRRPRLRASAIVLVLFAAAASPGHAQTRASLGAGFTVPRGNLGDVARTGFTLRGQVGLSLGLADGHVQAGWSRFSGADLDEGDLVVVGEDANVWHGGLGVRVGIGPFWVGANGFYSFGDTDDGLGFAPEVGVDLGPLEIVADHLFGDTKWFALRGAVRF